MKYRLASLAISLCLLCGCGKQANSVCPERHLPAGHFISWNEAQWVGWLGKAGFSEIQTKDDGLACDLRGSTPDNKQVTINFFSDGRLRELVFSCITMDMSATGRLETARRCLSMVGSLDPCLADSFAEIADTDREAAFMMNTRKYPWRNTPYVIGITTANKFWLEFNGE